MPYELISKSIHQKLENPILNLEEEDQFEYINNKLEKLINKYETSDQQLKLDLKI